MSPAPLQITVEETGSAKASLDLEKMGLRAEDVLPIWPVLDALFHEGERETFEREGPNWKPLADATVENKARLGLPPEIMRASNELFRSVTIAATGADESTTTVLRFGTDDPKARFHQYGTKTMPARKVVGISLKTRREMMAVLNEFVAHGVP